MFDIGFSELIVCAIVGLVVIGPERLPEAIRTVGLWIGRIKRGLRETREELERQVGMEDVRRQLHTEEMMRTLADMQEEIDTALNYERMGKNKLVAESLTSPSTSSEVTANDSHSLIHHENPSNIDSATHKDDVLIKSTSIKAFEKTEAQIVHH
ncbi:MAG: twin-arginine translocase subunit TatB [Gammaproteobacteria bacterium]|nr:MAG: twin-arginine translocase subunit TatB [Gammaproteobacteria bacterium]